MDIPDIRHLSIVFCVVALLLTPMGCCNAGSRTGHADVTAVRFALANDDRRFVIIVAREGKATIRLLNQGSIHREESVSISNSLRSRILSLGRRALLELGDEVYVQSRESSPVRVSITTEAGERVFEFPLPKQGETGHKTHEVVDGLIGSFNSVCDW